MLDEIKINKKNKVVVPRCAAINDYIINSCVWIADNELVCDRELMISGVDSDLKYIKKLNRKLMEEELDFVSH